MSQWNVIVGKGKRAVQIWSVVLFCVWQLFLWFCLNLPICVKLIAFLLYACFTSRRPSLDSIITSPQQSTLVFLSQCGCKTWLKFNSASMYTSTPPFSYYNKNKCVCDCFCLSGIWVHAAVRKSARTWWSTMSWLPWRHCSERWAPPTPTPMMLWMFPSMYIFPKWMNEMFALLPFVPTLDAASLCKNPLLCVRVILVLWSLSWSYLLSVGLGPGKTGTGWFQSVQPAPMCLSSAEPLRPS